MASQLYSRYVPPKTTPSAKRPHDSSRPPAPAAASTDPPPRAVSISELSTNGIYARYVPPKSQVSSRLDNKTVSTNGSDGAGKTRKRKRHEDREDRSRFTPEQTVAADGVNVHARPLNRYAETGSSAVDRSKRSQHKDVASRADLSEPKEQPMNNGTFKDKQISKQDESETQKRDPDTQEQAGSQKRPASKHSKRQHERHAPEDKNEDMSEQPRGKAAVLERYQRSSRHPAKSDRDDARREPKDDATDEPVIEINDLRPIPVPKATQETDEKPDDTLNTFYSSVRRLDADDRPPFREFKLQEAHLKILKDQGLSNALPIQAGAFSELLPHLSDNADVCISAATGSGKTLAYVLPIMENLAQSPEPLFPFLRALIIVPTRELVVQVHKTCEMLAAGIGFKVGTAVGSRSLVQEQRLLVDTQYRVPITPSKETSDDADFISCLDKEDLSGVPFRPEYYSSCHMLVATPGRLVEHIRNTRGFSLSFLQFLVIDESDRLLDDSFQEWTSVVDAAIKAEPPNRYATALDWDNPSRTFRTNLQKIIASATMSSDLDKLSRLNLRRPVLLQANDSDEKQSTDQRAAQGEQVPVAGLLPLPPTLEEWAIPVGDGSEKPLFLVSLLERIFEGEPEVLAPQGGKSTSGSLQKLQAQDSDDEDSDADSTSSSSVSSTVSSTVSSMSSDDSDDSESEESSESERNDLKNTPPKANSARAAKAGPPAVLIFTSTNESSARLSKLLSHLLPALKSRTAAILKTTSAAETARILARLRAGSLRVVIASDRVSRGLDVPALTDVISYDVPRSITAYVHRAGRTARAGRAGKAWTLTERKSAGWFWHVVAKGEPAKSSTDAPSSIEDDVRIGRAKGQKVRKVRLTNVGEGPIRARYEEALEKLKHDVMG